MREAHMRSIIIAAAGAAALFSSPAFTEQPSQGSRAIPDFSGLWAHPYFPGFEPPASGPGPVVNKSRVPRGPQAGRSSGTQFVGDYTNPIYRERSHFDGQDVLESGLARPAEPIAAGSLNRALVELEPDDRVRTSTAGRRTFAVGPITPLVVRGPAPVLSWFRRACRR
jgi:hypothetical protein